MKKLPLALSALAISTNLAMPVAAAPGDVTVATTEPFNVGQYDDLEFIIKDIYPHWNRILFEIKPVSAEEFELMAGQGKITFLGLGAAEDRNYETEAEADRRFLLSDEGGWPGEPSVMLLDTEYETYDIMAGAYTEIPMGTFTGGAPREVELTDNTSGVLYYRLERGEAYAPVIGKIDYSMCYNAKSFQEQLVTAAPEENLNCTINRKADGSYNYIANKAGFDLPYEEGELEELEETARARLTYTLVEPEPVVTPGEDDPGDDPENGGESGAGIGGDGGGDGDESGVGSGGEDANRGDDEGIGSQDGGVPNAVENTETGVEQGNGNTGSSRVGSTRYTTYATVASSGGSAYRNSDATSDETGVTEDYATDADVWAVDESKVWDEDATGVETPELGEEDCGHFWPLAIGWTLAVAGWGIIGAKRLLKRK